MANTYELIKKLENNSDFLNLLSKGVVPITIFEKKVYYEKFLIEEQKEQSKMQIITNVAEDCNVSEATIRRAINFMQS